MEIEAKQTCRVCGKGNLAPILSLGNQYVTNFLEDTSEEALRGPLELILCEIENGGCGLLQLKHTLPRDVLYRKYWYQSGISSTMIKALKDVVDGVGRKVPLEKGELVIDIGSNDGTLLGHFNPELQRVGFEPSNLWQMGEERGISTIHDYFNRAAFRQKFGERKAKSITSVAMFYDLDDPNEFVRDIRECLDPAGVWTIQMNYLGLMLEDTTFDNISHEHLEYYSLLSLENLLNRHNLEVFDVEVNDVNGGSFRTYIRHKGSNVLQTEEDKERLKHQREYERRMKMEGKEVYKEFERRTNEVKTQLRDFLRQEVQQGRRTYIFGASTRGLVVLQHAGIDYTLIDAATDKNPDKIGKFIVGTGIPIVSLEDYRRNPPDNLLVLPYQFRREIVNQEQSFLRNGGKMIYALPKFEVVDKGELEK